MNSRKKSIVKNKLTLSIIFRSGLFWLLSVLSLPVYNIVIILFIWPLPPQLRHRLVTTAAYYYVFLLKHVAGIKYNLVGLENLPNKPAIIASNHQSAWETVVFNCIFPPIVWIMKKEVLTIPFFGWGVRTLSPIAIDRKRGDNALAQVIQQGKKRIAMGFWICIFPEGTRVKPKKRKPFKYGTAKLALKLNVPIVPVAHNAGYCLPKNSFWLYPGTVSVIIGKPVYPQNDDAVLYTHIFENWITTQLEQIGS